MKRVLVCAALVAAVLSIGGARAYFTAQTEMKDNVVTAGTVTVSVEPTSAALTIDSLAPGETVTRSIQIANTGTLAVDAITTSAKKAGITDFWNALTCRVTKEGVTLYEGPLATLRTTPIRIDKGGSATVSYAITLPPEADNGLQGDYVKLSVYVDAEQVH